MNMRTGTVTASVAVLAALAAWAGVFAYAAWLSEQVDAQRSRYTDAQTVAEREIAAVRLHALARDTQNLRTQLETIARPDIVGIANTIDSLGKIAGVTVRIGEAMPEVAPGKRTASTTPILHGVGFVVEANGTFQSVMHAAALLAALPALSSLQSLDLEHVPSSAGGRSGTSAQWHLTARIRMLTTADISS